MSLWYPNSNKTNAIQNPHRHICADSGTQPHLHGVDTAVLGPATHSLAKEVEDDATQAPEEDEGGVGHDWLDCRELLATCFFHRRSLEKGQNLL